MYLTPLAYANPRRRRRRSSYRRNPVELYDNPRRRRRRRNPDILGIDLGDAGGTILGAIGTAYADSALVGPLAGRALSAAGAFQPAVQALIAAFGVHWILRRVSPSWARRTSGGGALYAVIGAANAVAPGLIPITIGVPTQLSGFHPLGLLGGKATVVPALASSGAGGTGGTTSQTGGLRIMSKNGL